ncbi:glutamate-5-semialdehyde dehydrogenase [Phocaeicola paurosaccharolyticus]|uniref:glutamate-5-semialdehyde dehydrogenase n=1 Tax=Phocaeicola paurosaccharolyticus TaxID=732242 RepID=UPI000468190B|nr:glutamate-5-semialdehyde dehydrogenase [Phocaeicola paurosaccharolyticus]
MYNIENQLSNVRRAAKQLQFHTKEQINDLLNDLADVAQDNAEIILQENRKDLDLMDPANPKYDRLKLTVERIGDIAQGIRTVARLNSPVGQVLDKCVRPNGLEIKRVSVPFGVIGIIYEARPNVTLDVFSLCLKSGNACVLKGGSDADFSNRAIVEVIKSVLKKHGFNEDTVLLLPAGHESTTELLNARGYVDLLIPRGGRGLIDYVRENAKIPVIETGAGVCHTYFHNDGDAVIGMMLIKNAKTRRVSVCNALDCVLVDRKRIADLPSLCSGLQHDNVIIFADDEAYDVMKNFYPKELLLHADESTFGIEFLDYKMAIKVVDGIEEATEHISKYGSGHSECIITENREAASYFQRAVDAACVYVNVPTSFTDGAEFGLGAEIGISTQKLHARGPMGLKELNTYKWIIEGHGQIR